MPQAIRFPSLCFGCGAPRITLDALASQYACGTSITIQNLHAEVNRGEKCLHPEPLPTTEEETKEPIHA